MEIRQYNYKDTTVYSKFIRRYNKSKYLDTLNIQTLFKGKKIYLMIEKKIFNRYKIIGYAIIYEELYVLALDENISTKYNGDTNTIYISDFMIDYMYRKQENGKVLAKYILEDLYRDKNIILQPDGDGYWFWNKFGFENDNISKHETWILKRRGI